MRHDKSKFREDINHIRILYRAFTNYLKFSVLKINSINISDIPTISRATILAVEDTMADKTN